MNRFPDGFRALILGASGGIGQAFVQALQANPRCAQVVGLHRQSEPHLNFDDEASIGAAAEQLHATCKFHLIINAAGVLHTADFMPEKKLGDLSYAQLEATFRVNTFGPALVLRHFSALLDRQRGVLAVISAKVGASKTFHGATGWLRIPAIHNQTWAAAAPSGRSPAHYLWAMLLARLFASRPLVCPNCGADRRIVAFITEAAPVRRILTHVGEPAEPPRIAPARRPPVWDDPPIDLGPDWEALAQPSPEYVFNQEVQW